MSEKMKRYIANELKNEIKEILVNERTTEELDELANDALAKIDWEDSALMHKDMKWLANYYLQIKNIA